MTKISAMVVADSKNPQGDRITTMLITFPRIILAEVNTHRMLSKNTSSSRAIPFNKMVEAIENNSFIPIAWQRSHSGMQGTEYITDLAEIQGKRLMWLAGRDRAIQTAKDLHEADVTKQLANRLLEPFMWTTMLITGPKSGWDNFFNLRCPNFDGFKSRLEWLAHNPEFMYAKDDSMFFHTINKGQAEIHMMALAEAMWDAMNESTPKELKAGEWHIPFGDKVFTEGSDMTWMTGVKISTAMCARTSYTVVGDEKEFALEQQIALHDRMANQVPFHASPFEHCAKAMTDEEYTSFIKGKVPQFKDDWGIGVHERYFVRTKKMFEEDLSNFTPYNKETTYLHGWCRNFKGFIQYREILENGNSSN